MWYLDTDGNYINADTGLRLRSVDVGGGTWRIAVATLASIMTAHLEGDYTSQAEAQDAARRLCQGVDPSTITQEV